MFRRRREKENAAAAGEDAVLVVGLGNVGVVYDGTRHNVGFDAADALAKQLGVRLAAAGCRAYSGTASVDGKFLIIAKPTTYMNLSGQSVEALMAKYRIAPARLLVVYDDIDLAVGTVRMRKKGSAGTHNGMRSIIEDTGTEEFPRIRIGIGRGDGDEELKDYVLGRPNADERAAIDAAVDRAVCAAIAFVREGADRAMQIANAKAPARADEPSDAQ